MLPPPQEARKRHRVRGASHRYFRLDRLGARIFIVGTTTIPSIVMAKVHDQGRRGDPDGCKAAMVGDVVVTEKVKIAGTVELNGTLAGTEQFTPLGVGVVAQVKEAVPLIPTPPSERV